MSHASPTRLLTLSGTLPARDTSDTAGGRPAAELPAVGAVLGKYRLTGVLGEGSTCRVYRGEHTRLPLSVAVKVFTAARWDDPAVLAQVRQEAALLCGLNHPNIIRLWDFDDEGPHPFLVTELVDGRPLSELLAGGKPLVPDWAVHLATQAVDGLEAALELGIVHRDVKPHNLLLTKDGRVKIADLGLAVTVGPPRAGAANRPAPSAVVTGTAGYIAPEQARGAGPVDHRADIYSLGATLYHCLCGRLPFPGRSAMEVIFKHLQQPPAPPAEVVPHVPPRLSGLVLRMMAKAPADRFATYAELRGELLAALDD